MPNTQILKLYNGIKVLFLALIPISLFISLKLNSVFIIVSLALCSVDVFKNVRKWKEIKTVFFLSLSFVLSVLIGFFLDSFYGILDFKVIERLLPFLIFPIIFLFNDDRISPKIIKFFSYGITLTNLVLIIYAIFFTLKKGWTDQFPDDVWKEFGVRMNRDVNIQAPNGGQNVIKLTENQEEESHDLIYNIYNDIEQNQEYFRSVFVKSAEKEWVLIRQYDGINHKGVWFNISKGYIGKKEDGLIGEIEKFDNGWYKCSVINVTDNDAISERIQITLVNGNGKFRHKGDGKSGLYLWGPQIGLGKNINKELPSGFSLNFRGFFRENLLKPLSIHPTYYSIFIITAIVFFLTHLFFKFKYSDLGFVIFNSLIVLFISSKGAILSLFAILLFLLFFFYKKQRKMTLILNFLLLASFSTILLFPTLKHRVKQSVETILYNKKDGLSTSDRLTVWNSIFEFESKDLLIGMGNRNGEKMLNKKTKLDLNAHNQYLQALINGGVFGLVLLIIYLGLPLFQINKFSDKEKVFIICFVILILINSFFESILNRQWGIVFVSFFYSVFNQNAIFKKTISVREHI